MRLLFLTACVAAAASAQPKLPDDVDPKSYSRLPLIERSQLSGDALKTYDAIALKDENGNPRPTPSLGPMATSLYSMGVALPMNDLNQYIRVMKPGIAMWHLCAIVAARDFDEIYEWYSHAEAALQTGIDPATVEAIKYDRDTTGLPPKEALVVRFGRALLRDHKVSPELYAQVVKEFGQQGMFELTAAIGDYVMAALMLRAVDQHVPTGPVDLPPIERRAR